MRTVLLAILLAAAPAWASEAPTPLVLLAAELADERFAGREAGTDGELLAADWIEAQLDARGIGPIPGWTTRRHRFDFVDHDGESRQGANILAWLPPNAADAVAAGPGRVVLAGAHYDHLGLGRTPHSRARPDERGRVHPGADDNASGVAALLGAADRLAAQPRRRGIVLAFWSAEEFGALGAKAFLDEQIPDPAAIRAAVNIDAVGRLGDGPLLWNACEGFPAELPQGLPLREHPEPFGDNDAEALRAVGIPTLDLSTALHEDYHRPTDTADKLDGAGIERVADFAAAILLGLANGADAR